MGQGIRLNISPDPLRLGTDTFQCPLQQPSKILNGNQDLIIE